MTNVLSNELILKSIGDLRSRRKHPDHESVVSHAEKHYGLSIEDGRESFSCLLNNGSIHNEPTQAGLISLFLKEDSVGKMFETNKLAQIPFFKKTSRLPKRFF